MNSLEAAPASSLDLTDFLPYLLARSGMKMGQVFSQYLQKFGLALSDWRILIALWQNDRQRLLELAEVTVVDVSTLSRQIGALEDAGLVIRKRCGKDGRALNLMLTAKGKRLTAKIIPIARSYEAIAIAGLSETELATFKRWLAVVHENLHAFDEQRKKSRTSEETSDR